MSLTSIVLNDFKLCNISISPFIVSINFYNILIEKVKVTKRFIYHPNTDMGKDNNTLKSKLVGSTTVHQLEMFVHHLDLDENTVHIY